MWAGHMSKLWLQTFANKHYARFQIPTYSPVHGLPSNPEEGGMALEFWKFCLPTCIHRAKFRVWEFRLQVLTGFRQVLGSKHAYAKCRVIIITASDTLVEPPRHAAARIVYSNIPSKYSPYTTVVQQAHDSLKFIQAPTWQLFV